ncbi:MAG: thioredoxin family protein, partial [Chryseobacterium sp.]
IIYTENNEIQELNMLYKKQEDIFARHDAMFQATKAFSVKDKNYRIFEKEYQAQLKAYENLQNELKKKNDYPAKFINIVNITKGIGTQIFQSEKERARNIGDYIVQDLDWETLYTSGHWEGIISGWVAIHTQVFNDPKDFSSDFALISRKIKGERQYTDFVSRVAHALSQSGKDNFIAEISPMVVASGKITSYVGPLASYVSGAEESQAPDLDLRDTGNTILKSKDFAGAEYNKTLMLFYESGCGACEDLLQDLPKKYEKLKSAGVRIISISSDLDEKVFKNKAKDLPWKDNYCDYKGIKGINFKNYGIVGTPTLFLIDKNGKIVLRQASLKGIMDKL